MKYQIPNLALIVFLFVACNQHKKIEDARSQSQLVFPKGNRNTTDNFLGEVWVKSLVDADSMNQNSVGNVTFAPGARSKWHLHPAGQILLVTGGVGYYQEEGKTKLILRKGDVIKCPPNVPHWHGASQDTAFVQLAISSRDKGPTVWMGSVTDSVYNAAGKDAH